MKRNLKYYFIISMRIKQHNIYIYIYTIILIYMIFSKNITIKTLQYVQMSHKRIY